MLACYNIDNPQLKGKVDKLWTAKGRSHIYELLEWADIKMQWKEIIEKNAC